MKHLSLVLLSITLCAACTAVGPDYEQPTPSSPPQWTSELEGGLTAAALDPATLSQWWRTLGDSTLDKLIDQAVAANLDLRAADAQLRQARAERGIATANRFPTITASGSATQSGSSANAGTGSTNQLYAASFDASWELDVFGGQRRAVEASDADLQASAERRRDVLVSVLAEVALNYTELRTFQAQLQVAQQNLALQSESQEIVQAQFDAGAVTELDLDQAISSVALTRAELPRIKQNINRSMNRLAVLSGATPGALHTQLAVPASLPVPEIQIAVGVPADTLRRRPDVRQAERQLAAETARIGVAKAELYPKFSLNGSIGLESLSLSDFATGGSRAFNIGPSVQWPIFNRGRIRQKIEIQDAVQEQAMIAYEASVLTALEDVENALTAFAQEQVRYQSLAEAASASRRAANVAQLRYDAGASNFLTVLDSQRTLLNAEDKLAASKGEIVSNLIRLYKALGGGWTTY